MCATADCLQLAHAGGVHCAGHAKRLERGQTTAAPLREKLPLRERVLKLAIDLVDCDSEDDNAYERAFDALRKAVEQWARQGSARRARATQLAEQTPARRSEIARIGALARAARLSPERRRSIARTAVQARILLASQQASVRPPAQPTGKRRGARR